MLDHAAYIERFLKIQKECMSATNIVANACVPGISELKLADTYRAVLAEAGMTKEWYPTLICAGQYSGQPLTRRNHLPSANALLRKDDIVILDTTPMDGHVWGNWTITKSIGTNPFYHKLCTDIFGIVIETAASTSSGECKGLAAIHTFAMKRAKKLELESIDPRGNVGHSIFQIPEGQTVDQTPSEDRIFIDQDDTSIPEKCLISIEPELARINPDDGVRYGGKFQFIIPYGYGSAGQKLIAMQLGFYEQMAGQHPDQAMNDHLKAYKSTLLAQTGAGHQPQFNL